MENRLSVRKVITKQTKQSQNKIKPIKVVYISNPMKVKTSVSEFRSLVQELTGRDSDLSVAIDRTKFSNTTNEVDGLRTVWNDDDRNLKVLPSNDYGLIQENHGVDSYWNNSSDLPIFGAFDDFFVPQIVENMNGFLPNSSLFYGAHPPLVDCIQQP